MAELLARPEIIDPVPFSGVPAWGRGTRKAPGRAGNLPFATLVVERGRTYPRCWTGDSIGNERDQGRTPPHHDPRRRRGRLQPAHGRGRGRNACGAPAAAARGDRAAARRISGASGEADGRGRL